MYTLHFNKASDYLDACKHSIKRGNMLTVLQSMKTTCLLRLACTHQDADLVKILLDNEADYLELDEYRRTILHSSIPTIDSRIIADILIKANRDRQDNTLVNIKDTYGKTALHYAAQHPYLDVINLLLGFGARINEKDDEGNTPLHEACCCSPREVVNTLLLSGADASLLNDEGESPLDIAKAYRNKSAYILLKILTPITDQ